MTENGDDSPTVGENSQSNWESTSTHRPPTVLDRSQATAPGGRA